MRTRITAVLVTATLTASALAAPTSAAPAERQGNRSLAKVLATDGNEFDENWNDFDILDRAIRDVLDDNPDSDVAIVKKGRKRLTAFLPTDRAFRRLVAEFQDPPDTEEEVYTVLAGFGLELIESVLLYHLVPKQTLTFKTLKRMDGDRLRTAQGQRIRIRVNSGKVVLVDKDPDLANPRIIGALKNINKGNKQIGQAINGAMLHVDIDL
jgi:uncharacterized surface protein with fasciclin (FAS1) repeats